MNIPLIFTFIQILEIKDIIDIKKYYYLFIRQLSKKIIILAFEKLCDLDCKCIDDE